MSKERALRRAEREREREREQAIRAAARARQEERRQRAVARRRAVTGRLPARHRTPGLLAARQRRQAGATLAVLLVVNVVTWVASPQWSLRVLVALVSVLAAPVLHTLLFRRR